MVWDLTDIIVVLNKAKTLQLFCLSAENCKISGVGSIMMTGYHYPPYSVFFQALYLNSLL